MHRLALVASILSATACSLAGCSGSSAGGSLSTGRTVLVNSDQTLRRIDCQYTANTATIALGNRKIVVQPTSVILDGTLVATISRASKVVTVFEANRKLLIRADGALVFETKF